MDVKPVDLVEFAESLRFRAAVMRYGPPKQEALFHAFNCAAAICERHGPDDHNAVVRDLRYWSDIFGRYAEMIVQLNG